MEDLQQQFWHEQVDHLKLRIEQLNIQLNEHRALTSNLQLQLEQAQREQVQKAEEEIKVAGFIKKPDVFEMFNLLLMDLKDLQEKEKEHPTKLGLIKEMQNHVFDGVQKYYEYSKLNIS